MNQGILLIALGHKNYGCMAANLAMSIRANGVQIPITLATQADTIARLDENYKSLFTSIIECPAEYYTLNDNETCYIKSKAHMNDLTTYDETLFIDADVIMNTNSTIGQLLEELKGVDFAIKNRGKNNTHSIWADMAEVIQKYELQDRDIYEVHSEFIYFKKDHPAMIRWAENFNDLKVTHTNFGDCIPDELPLFIAMAETNTKPHKDRFNPIYWPYDTDNQLDSSEINKGYVGLSIGGSKIAQKQLDMYNNRVVIFTRIMNMVTIFRQLPKRNYLSNRQKL
jgi:hypothetical protein